MPIMEIFPALFFQILLLYLLSGFCSAADTVSSSMTISYGETLVSSGQCFELGFFSPGNSSKWYIGIWYKEFPEIVVWVANRDHPLRNSSGVLTIGPDGDLVLLNATTGVVWSSNSSRTEPGSAAQLLESGNLVLKRKDDTTESYIWQSFDFPSDTLLPGMKIGWNLSTGVNRYLTSWKDENDPSPGDITYRIDNPGRYLTSWKDENEPSPGDVTYRIDNPGMPQFVLRRGSEKIYRSGPWNGIRFSGIGLPLKTIFKYNHVFNNESLYYMNEASDNSIITRLTVNQSGLLQRFVLNKGDFSWTTMYSSQYDQCEEYGVCGANGICKISKRPICECLDGFVPKSRREWDVHHWSNGCVRRIPLDCHQGEQFLKVARVKLPDLLEIYLNKSMSVHECQPACFKNCYCIAYAYSDIRGNGSGCLMWFGNLIDIREFSQENSQQDIYVRMPASEIYHKKKTRHKLIFVVSSLLFGILFFGFLIWCLIQRRKRKRGSETNDKDIELPRFDLITITNATNNFSSTNMIGEGGFGIVYKGTLSTGQEVAVKRLSKNSGQGLQEFKNEVILIAKLQHRNLVRLLGCCLEGDERMLIYEYMPNKSLDYFIFDQNRKALLTWKKRFEIIMGISRGLLYLHRDSRLRIIHRDLKTSNILLDSDLNAKISDFGLARSFGGDQTEINTKRVVGTHGYMSPEYVVDGQFSVKSDVFSFGVLLLEIVSNRKNRRFHHPEHDHNLLGHAWLFFTEGRAWEIVDDISELSPVESEVLRCIHVGLLCVQKLPHDRPTMASVVVMLDNKGMALPRPKEPGFFVERSCIEADMSTSEESGLTHNVVTMSELEAR